MTENGPCEFALVNGYTIADRTLEGVMFKVTVIEGEIRCLGHDADSHDYMKRFSERQLAEWDEAIVKSCKEDVDGLHTSPDGEGAWFELVETPEGDPLKAVRESNEPADDFVDSKALLNALGRGERIPGTLTPRR